MKNSVFKSFHRTTSWAITSAVLLLIVLCSSCKKGDNPVENPITDIAGTWIGSYSTSLISDASVTITLTQNSNNVSGTFITQSGATGNISSFSGTMNGNQCNFLLEETTQNCPGSFTGTTIVSGDTMNFTFTGSDCLGEHSNGNGKAVRIHDIAGGDLIPLKVGNKWILKTPNAPTDSPLYIDTIEVVKDTVVNGETWYYVIGLPLSLPLLTNRSNGVWIVGYTQYLKWKYPAITNEIYQSANDSIKVVSTNETRTTTAGQFKCYRYQTLNPIEPYPGDTYISPNTGFVRIFIKHSVRVGPILVLQIIEYELVEVILK